MAKLTKEELIEKFNATSLSDEEKVSFMEDITDSFEVADTTELDNAKAELENKTREYDSLLEKYKARFLSKDVELVDEEEKVKEPEMEEKEYVDVKDIFTEEKED